MNVLAIDTSGPVCGVCILSDGAVRYEAAAMNKLTHSTNLMPMIDTALAASGMALKDMDRIAVVTGPGSFTGVRIGVAAAKGFAWGGEIPCYGISTLEAMAETLGIYQGYVCPCMDARRSQVYNALFYVNRRVMERIQPDRAMALSDLGEELKNLPEPVFLVGDGSVLCYNTLKEAVPGLVLPPEHRMHQRASGVALLAERKVAAGKTGDANGLTPNYLRLSQAERERLARLKIDN